MKKIALIISSLLCPMMLMAQAAPEAMLLSEPQLRGTARFLGMAGAFGALGGDVSVLNQNPAGIGVYRSSDLSLTLDLEFQNSSAAQSGKVSQNKFNANNVGYVAAFKTGSDVMPYFNFGVSYNRAKSFNRHSSGRFRLNTSVSNYIASLATAGGYTESDLRFTDNYNPYAGGAPWVCILGYDGYLITPNSTGGFNGQFANGYGAGGTTGEGGFQTIEDGRIDEYSVNFGGNIYDVLYWGIGLGLTDTDYHAYTYYGEDLTDAYIADENNNVTRGDASTGIENNTRIYGEGVNFKMGMILKPINELRFGIAFHTPTYHSLKMERWSCISYDYSNGINGTQYADEGYVSESWYKQSTPWRVIASAAAVLGGKAILSVDYEWNDYASMRLSSDDGIEYFDITGDIKTYYKSTNCVRVGAEYRLTKQFSVRAGYSYTSSPVKDEIFNNTTGVVTAGTDLHYMLPKSTEYGSVGFGYRYKNFYTDLTYMVKKSDTEYHAFSPDEFGNDLSSPSSLITNRDHHAVWTIGLRF